MAAAADKSERLRTQRNLAVWVAVLLIAGSTAAAFPRFLKSQSSQMAANQELRDLQQSLLDVQQQTRIVQGEILQAQREIKDLQRESP